MKKKYISLSAAFIVLLLAFAPVLSLAEPNVAQNIHVSLSLAGETPPSKATFTFMLVPGNSDTPMPAVDKIAIKGAGTNQFGPIYYDEPNDYTYKLHQVSGNLTGYTYDAKVYDVTVRVTSDNAGNLSATVWMTKENGSTKYSIAGFENNFRVRTDIPKTGYDDEARGFIDGVLAWLKDAV